MCVVGGIGGGGVTGAKSQTVFDCIAPSRLTGVRRGGAMWKGPFQDGSLVVAMQDLLHTFDYPPSLFTPFREQNKILLIPPTYLCCLRLIFPTPRLASESIRTENSRRRIAMKDILSSQVRLLTGYEGRFPRKSLFWMCLFSQIFFTPQPFQPPLSQLHETFRSIHTAIHQDYLPSFPTQCA